MTSSSGGDAVIVLWLLCIAGDLYLLIKMQYHERSGRKNEN